MASCLDIVTRPARPEDFDGVMALTEDDPEGIDYLYGAFHTLVRDPNSYAYVSELGGKPALPIWTDACRVTSVWDTRVTSAWDARVTSVWGQQQVRYRIRHGKHKDPKWRRERGRKVLKVDLPDYDKYRRESKMTPEEMRAEMKKSGNLPPRTFQERPLVIACTSTVFEGYVPPEGDGRSTVISKDGAKQRVTELEKKGKSFLQLRKVRQFEEGFDTKEFALKAQGLYVEANRLLESIEDNEDRLHDLVTEKAYPEMVWKLEKKTFRWSFVESLEPPRVVHVRTQDMLSKENLYGQVTVRFHTKQTLAIYDRFGRLMYGSEKLVKDVLEYLVFEKHLSDEYGRWRIHGKIIPDWMPPREAVIRTMKQPKFSPIVEDEAEDGKESSDKTEITKEEAGPAMATA